MSILTQLSPWMKYDILWNHLYEDHIWRAALILDQVWASCGPTTWRQNNNNRGLIKFVNIIITKVLIFVNVSLSRPYWVCVLVKFGWPYNVQRRSAFGEIWRRDDRTGRYSWHNINAVFSEATWLFQIPIYRLSSKKFYLRSVYSPSVILTPYSNYTSWSSPL
jgi:hypothetical protein